MRERIFTCYNERLAHQSPTCKILIEQHRRSIMKANEWVNVWMNHRFFGISGIGLSAISSGIHLPIHSGIVWPTNRPTPSKDGHFSQDNSVVLFRTQLIASGHMNLCAKLLHIRQYGPTVKHWTHAWAWLENSSTWDRTIMKKTTPDLTMVSVCVCVRVCESVDVWVSSKESRLAPQRTMRSFPICTNERYHCSWLSLAVSRKEATWIDLTLLVDTRGFTYRWIYHKSINF